jgi:hypothetical protein
MKLSKYQEKRLEKLKQNKGTPVFLAGTEGSTKVSGTIVSFKVVKPRKNLKILYGLLFEGQNSPIYGSKKAFVFAS